MQTFTQTLPIALKSQLPGKYATDDILFFDIETTGLSPASSYIFLIGCGHFSDDNLILTQWLMDELSDEALLLKSFFEYAASFKRIIHYNGTTFDIPFLQKRSKLYNIPESFFKLAASDVYKNICKYKKLFNAPDYKLKTIEKLSGFKRTDRLDGMQLIDTFIKYIGRKGFETICAQNRISVSDALTLNKKTELISVPTESAECIKQLLLLHNTEDILGLVNACTLLNIERFISGDFSLDAFIYDDYSLFLRLKTRYRLPACLNSSFDSWILEKQDDFIYIEASLEHTRSYFGNIDNFLANEMLLYDYACTLLKTI